MRGGRVVRLRRRLGRSRAVELLGQSVVGVRLLRLTVRVHCRQLLVDLVLAVVFVLVSEFVVEFVEFVVEFVFEFVFEFVVEFVLEFDFVVVLIIEFRRLGCGQRDRRGRELLVDRRHRRGSLEGRPRATGPRIRQGKQPLRDLLETDPPALRLALVPVQESREIA